MNDNGTQRSVSLDDGFSRRVQLRLHDIWSPDRRGQFTYASERNKRLHKAFRGFARSWSESYGELQGTSIFISYAWAVPGSDTYLHDKRNEWLTRRIAEDLKDIGFTVYLDRWHDHVRSSTAAFINHMDTASCILLAGSELYTRKRLKRTANRGLPDHVVRIEAAVIEYLASYNETTNNRIVPVLLDGTPETSLPLVTRDRCKIDFQNTDYFFGLLRLACDLVDMDPDQRSALQRELDDHLIGTGAAELTILPEDTPDSPARRATPMQTTSHIVHELPLPTRNPSFSGRETCFDELDARLATNARVGEQSVYAICGMRGSGKSTFAAEYAYRQLERDDCPFTKVAWMAMDTPELRRSSWLKLARSLELDRQHDLETMNSELLASICYAKLAETPYLLIFDNPGTYESMRTQLPPSSIRSGHCILLTSVHQGDWQHPILIEPFTDAEAITYLRTCYEYTLHEDEPLGGSVMHHLNLTLGGLPLALGLAVSHMRSHGHSIRDFLDQPILDQLERQNRQRQGADNTYTIDRLWRLELASFRRSPRTLRLLIFISLLPPDDIQKSVLYRLFPDKVWLDRTLRQLTDSCILNERGNQLSIHRLLGAVICRERLGVDLLEEEITLTRREFLVLLRSWILPLQRVLDDSSLHEVDTQGDYEVAEGLAINSERLLSLLDRLQIPPGCREKHDRNVRDDLMIHLLVGHGLSKYKQCAYAQSGESFQRAQEIAAAISSRQTLVEAQQGSAKVHTELGSFSAAVESYELALRSRRAQFGRHSNQVAETLYHLAAAYFGSGRYEEALANIRKAKHIFSESDNSVGRLRAIALEGHILTEIGQYDQPLTLYNEVQTIIEQLPPGNKKQYLEGTTRAAVGHVHRELGNYRSAIDNYRLALAMLEEALGERPHTEIGIAHHDLGQAHFHNGEDEEAAHHYSEALRINRIALKDSLREDNDNHPAIAMTLDNQGQVAHRQRRYDEALALHERARMVYEHYDLQAHPYMALVLRNIARVYRDRRHDGDQKRALSHYRQALLIQTSLPDGHPERAKTYSEMTELRADEERDTGDTTTARAQAEPTASAKSRHDTSARCYTFDLTCCCAISRWVTCRRPVADDRQVAAMHEMHRGEAVPKAPGA